MTEGISKLLAAMNAVMLEAGYVQKTGKNTFHGYKYAGEGVLLQELRPAMVKHGIILIPSLEGMPTQDEHGTSNLVMAYTIAHISGEVWPHPIRFPGAGNDKSKSGTVGDKGVYKALTGANKYALFKLFQIETGDDPEKDDEPAPKAEKTERSTQPDRPARQQDPPASDPQKTKIHLELIRAGWMRVKAQEYMRANFDGKDSRTKLTASEASRFIEVLTGLEAATKDVQAVTESDYKNPPKEKNNG